jgi:predicted tellurium resistance membrane protein TerC
MDHLLSAESLVSFITLAVLEVVLGIDNIIFLTILVGKLPESQRPLGRSLGLVLALGMRIVLLLCIKWLAGLTAGLFSVMQHEVSGRDLVLLLGGSFLIAKSTWEIFSGVEGEEPAEPATGQQARKAFAFILVQIVLMDIVFSLDSVITAVGIAQHAEIMIAAMVAAMLVMQVFAKPVGEFVTSHPSMKVLALGFLIMIGTLLVAEGGGQHVNKGYVYFAMGFAFIVELVNLRTRRRAEPARPLNNAPLETRNADQMPSSRRIPAAMVSGESPLQEVVGEAFAHANLPAVRRSLHSGSDEKTATMAAVDLHKVIADQARQIAELEDRLTRRR